MPSNPVNRGGPALLAIVLVIGASLPGCAHRTRIETNPSGVNVFVSDAFVCTTPCLYSVPATELKEAPLRLERPGYQPIESHLETHYAFSRIVGGVFTVGLVPLFKWPHTYKSLHAYNLRPLTTAEKLTGLDKRRVAGEITDDEYQRLRINVLSSAP